jgi:hypothetical protein
VPTQVCITIDTEFSIGGAFVDPQSRGRSGPENVTCPVGEENTAFAFCWKRSKRTASSRPLVEALQSIYFGMPDGPPR